MTDKTTAPATHQTEEEERPAVQALPSVEETARESREQRGEPQSETERETLFSVEDLTVRYGKKPAVEDVTFDIYKNNITENLSISKSMDTTSFFQKPISFKRLG